MARAEIGKVVEILRDAFEKKGIKVSQIVLFGSQARGTAGEESDIDLVVISEDFAGKDLFQRAEITGDVHWEVVKKVLVPLDIIAMTFEEWERGDFAGRRGQ